jgi:hypothetical protein
MLGIAAYEFDRGEKRGDYLAKQHEMHSERQFIWCVHQFVRKRVAFHYITKVSAENFFRCTEERGKPTFPTMS